MAIKFPRQFYCNLHPLGHKMPVVEETPSFPFNLKTNTCMQFARNVFRHSVICRDNLVAHESEGECFISV